MMPAFGGDDFYIGWQDPPPPGVRRTLMSATRLLLAVAAGVAVLLASMQGPLRGGRFEFGVEREIEGVVSEHPAPSLRVARPGRVEGLDESVPVVSRWLLVAQGKHGAQELVAGLDGRHVRARGSLVFRDGQTLLELSDRPQDLDPVAASVLSIAPPGTSATLPLGRVTLQGEIVDSKCSFGVMVPGEGRAHRACAIRCLSGGIPPVFRVRTEDGGALCLLLVGRDGRALNQEILDRVAEPLTITGEVERHDDLLVLRAEPAEFVPAPGLP